MKTKLLAVFAAAALLAGTGGFATARAALPAFAVQAASTAQAQAPSDVVKARTIHACFDNVRCKPKLCAKNDRRHRSAASVRDHNQIKRVDKRKPTRHVDRPMRAKRVDRDPTAPDRKC